MYADIIWSITCQHNEYTDRSVGVDGRKLWGDAGRGQAEDWFFSFEKNLDDSAGEGGGADSVLAHNGRAVES